MRPDSPIGSPHDETAHLLCFHLAQLTLCRTFTRIAADTNPERAAEFARKANLAAAKPGQVYFVSRAGKP